MQDTPALLASTFRAMAALVANPEVVLQGLNVKVLNVMEGFLEVSGRFRVLGLWEVLKKKGLGAAGPERQGAECDEGLQGLRRPLQRQRRRMTLSSRAQVLPRELGRPYGL